MIKEELNEYFDTKLKELVLMSHQQNAKSHSNVMGEIRKLEKNIIEIRHEIDQLKTEYSSHKEAHVDLRESIKELNIAINKLTSEIGRGDIKNTKIDGELHLLENTVKEVDKRVSGMSTKLWWAVSVIIGAIIIEIISLIK